jgi:hypothetical protein
MGKRELKKQYKEFDFSVVDFMTRFDTTENNKLTPFLMKMFKSVVEDDGKMLKKARLGGPPASERIVNPKNMWENIMKNNITDFVFNGNENVELLEKFANHLSENRIDDPDINNYNSWGDIAKAVSKADVKFLEKELSNQIKVVYQDDTWLFLKPLSLKASQTYGMGTKWCTSMKHDPSYFYRYSSEGILVYTINKKTGRKFGFYSSPSEFSVWDSVDKRVDSLETRIPIDLLAIVRESLDLDTNPTNDNLFSEEELREKSRMYGKNPIFEYGEDDAEDVMEMELTATNEMVQAEITISPRPEMVGGSDDSWEPRGADVAFGNAPMAGMAIEAEMPQEVMEAEPMYITENEVMDAPANVSLEVYDEDVDMEIGYDEPDVAGVMDL